MLNTLPVLHELCNPPRPRLGLKARATYKGRLRSLDPRCFYCGRAVCKRSSTLDHIVPRSKGGPDSPANLVLCCKRCNTLKADLTPVEWLDLAERIAAAVRFYLVAEVATG